MYGVRPAAGRTFARDEDQPGKEKVAVVTHRAWASLFGGDPGLVNRDILLNGERYTVIGILPGNSEFDRAADRPVGAAGVPVRIRRATITISASSPG